MPDFLHDKSEKKVQYLELVYDLIFVYLVSRNGDLLHVESGFITASRFLTYLASTVVILQIWFESTQFINRYGDGSTRMYIGLFVNMYLLYYMADGIVADWGAYFFRYGAAWTLILLNLAAQYALLLRLRPDAAETERRHARAHMIVLLVDAGVVAATIPIYLLTGAALTPVALVIAFAATALTHRIDAQVPADFPHLAERVMLYIVFTFGEMILAIAGYFSGEFSAGTLYYSLMAFLIVAGLFLGYGYYYEHLLNSETQTTGTLYMLLHIVMVLALNNITAGLALMRDPDVAAVPKNILLVGSFVVYFVCLLMTQRYAVRRVAERRFYGQAAVCFAVYCGVMALVYRYGAVSILVSVAFIYMQLYALRHAGTEK